MNADDIETTLRARASFDASVERLDRDTRQRLRTARLKALEADVRPTRANWMWGAGMATAAALALAVFMPLLPRTPAPVAMTSNPVAVAPRAVTSSPLEAAASPALSANTQEAVDAGELDTADPDMLSDLEFYGWLARQPGGKNNVGG